MGNEISSNGECPDSENELRKKPSVMVELFKWSSKQFPVEYAVIYTSNSDKERRCVVQVSASRSKAQFIIHDTLCSQEEVLMKVEVNILRSNQRGTCRLGTEKVGCNMEMETPETMPSLSRLCMNRYKAREIEISVSRSSMFYPLPGFDEDHLTISHYLPASVSSVEQLGVKVQIWCHSREGIEVILQGPSFGPSFNPERYVDREVEGIPKDFSSYSNVKIDKCMFPSIKPQSIVGSSNLSATGAINSVNAVTNGKYNNSIYHGCNFYS